MVVASMRIGGTLDFWKAVLVVEEHEADADDANAEEEESSQAHLDRLGMHVHLRHAFGSADVDVDAAAIGEQHALCEVIDVRAKDNEHAEDHLRERGVTVGCGVRSRRVGEEGRGG